jgi:hypothetical protein
MDSRCLFFSSDAHRDLPFGNPVLVYRHVLWPFRQRLNIIVPDQIRQEKFHLIHCEITSGASMTPQTKREEFIVQRHHSRILGRVGPRFLASLLSWPRKPESVKNFSLGVVVFIMMNSPYWN